MYPFVIDTQGNDLLCGLLFQNPFYFDKMVFILDFWVGKTREKYSNRESISRRYENNKIHTLLHCF